jgi:hypothetical protein
MPALIHSPVSLLFLSHHLLYSILVHIWFNIHALFPRWRYLEATPRGQPR